jgi:hypothetical protein
MKLKALSAALLLIGAAPAAMAQRPMLYDGRNVPIGTLLWQNEVLMRIGGQDYWLNATMQGLVNDAEFFYSSSNCSGTPYLEFSTGWYMVPYAVFDGVSIWGPVTSEETTLNVNSYGRGPGSCSSYQTTTLAAPAHIIEPTVAFRSPYSVR